MKKEWTLLVHHIYFISDIYLLDRESLIKLINNNNYRNYRWTSLTWIYSKLNQTDYSLQLTPRISKPCLEARVCLTSTYCAANCVSRTINNKWGSKRLNVTKDALTICIPVSCTARGDCWKKVLRTELLSSKLWWPSN